MHGRQHNQDGQRDLTPRQKQAILYAGVGLVMAIVIGFWAVSMRAALSASTRSDGQTVSGVLGTLGDKLNIFSGTLQDSQKEFSKTIDQAAAAARQVKQDQLKQQLLQAAQKKLQEQQQPTVTPVTPSTSN